MTEWREPRYFPVQCPGGHRPFLARMEPNAMAPSAESLRCEVCGAEGRMLPGAYYTAATRERFERVATILSEARLTREQIATVVAWLDRAARDSESETDAVLAALSKVAGLGPLSELVPNGPHERHGFVGLVLALLIAGVSSTPDHGAERAPSACGSRDEPAADGERGDITSAEVVDHSAS